MITNSSNVMDIMSKSLDAYWLRNDTISHNIANIDTPNYKRQEVKFEEILKEQLQDTKDVAEGRKPESSLKSYDDLRLEIYEQEPDMKYRLDGNNVDIDNEMAEVAKNSMRYNVVTSQINKQFSAMRIAMNKQ